jgi:hypothetical protein
VAGMYFIGITKEVRSNSRFPIGTSQSQARLVGRNIAYRLASVPQEGYAVV